MTSPRKRNANRLNAEKSTGPRSRRGKARAALNAVTHGLSSRPVWDAKSQEAVDTLARAFAGGDGDHASVLDLAHQAAEAQIQLVRVKEARSRVWEEAGRDSAITDRGKLFVLTNPGPAWPYPKQLASLVRSIEKTWPNHFKPPFETDRERDVAIVELAAKGLIRLIRYERRAANRRDRALRQLEQMKTDLLSSKRRVSLI